MSGYLFRPRLANGQAAPLPWQILVLQTILISWPLADDCPRWFRWLIKAYTMFTCLMYTYIHFGNWYYLYNHHDNVEPVLKCLCTYLVLVELQWRSFHTAWHKQRLGRFLQKFYGKFYVEQSRYPRHFGNIHVNSLPAIWYSLVYICTYVLYISNFFYDWWLGDLHPIFQQEWPYNMHDLRAHIGHMFVNFWVGYLAISQMYGETNLVALCVLHLTQRYKMLEEDIMKFAEKLLVNDLKPHSVARTFRMGLVDFIKRHAELQAVVAEMSGNFSNNLFVIFSMATLTLCMVLFNLTDGEFSLVNSQFLTWILAKVCELFVLSELGAQLSVATNQVSSIYYQSDWQKIIAKSSETAENVRVMKLILMAMQVNGQPARLNGLGFFRMAHGTVGKILQGTFSYYTFLDKVR